MQLDTEVLRAAYYPEVHAEYLRALGAWLFEGITKKQQEVVLDECPEVQQDEMKMIAKLMSLSMEAPLQAQEERRAKFMNPITADGTGPPPQTKTQLYNLVTKMEGEYQSLRPRLPGGGYTRS